MAADASRHNEMASRIRFMAVSRRQVYNLDARGNGKVA
jgi:hypothetical protein